MKTSELTGAALDWAADYVNNKCLEEPRLRGYNYDVEWRNHRAPRYSSQWSAGGPIIERQALSVYPFFCDGTKAGWSACDPHNLQYDEVGEFIDGSDFAQDGPTPLIAAMRCFVASKLGDEVEVPKELTP